MRTCFLSITRNGKTIECEITCEAHGPEHDVGIMGPWFEDICATDLETKEPVELTEDEEEAVSEKLTEMYFDDYEDYDL